MRPPSCGGTLPVVEVDPDVFLLTRKKGLIKVRKSQNGDGYPDSWKRERQKKREAE
jgi:hypothetical protein